MNPATEEQNLRLLTWHAKSKLHFPERQPLYRGNSHWNDPQHKDLSSNFSAKTVNSSFSQEVQQLSESLSQILCTGPAGNSSKSATDLSKIRQYIFG
ncbi:hypothetical protein PGT21_030902 [Puccinia graminis f. sp. tritici]|uniref:Uncharacterized protein n=1 Tax=Puccinia graminis f. sp. tritici TaxID=56615 RepID=A0A5B0MY58_PUCGR|nr:hypothetical protein PGT21_030902 [Puccinia graminis f. sp. tritici]